MWTKPAGCWTEAGWKKNKDGLLERDGKPFLFTILVNQGNDSRIKAAIIIQSQLKALGITVHIRTVEWAAFIKEFVNKGTSTPSSLPGRSPSIPTSMTYGTLHGPSPAG